MTEPAQTHRNWNAWSEADDARLRELIAENLSYAAIGKLMGRNKNSCIGRAHRLSIHTRDTKPISVRKVKKDVAKAVVKLFPPKPAPEPVEAASAQDNRPQARYEQPEAATTPFGIPRTLMGLQPHHCRWPVSGERGDTLFCCAQREGLGPYCAEHRAVAWRPTQRQLTTKAYR
jgi:GcrA cell cycle regulator